MGVVLGPKVDIVRGPQVEYHSAEPFNALEWTAAAVAAVAAGVGVGIAGITPSTTDPSTKDVYIGGGIATAGVVASLILFLNGIKLKLSEDSEKKGAESIEKAPLDPMCQKILADVQTIQATLNDPIGRMKGLSGLAKIQITEGTSAHMAETFYVACTEKLTLGVPGNWLEITDDQVTLNHKSKILLTADSGPHAPPLNEATIILEGRTLTLVVGKDTPTPSKITLTADGITLSAAASSITIDEKGVTVKGSPLINLN
jgi:hypothetical protein